MKKNTLRNIISTTIDDNSLEIVIPAKTKQNGDEIIEWSSKTLNLKLLLGEAGNFQSCSNQICQNWLKAHKTESISPESIQQYTKIINLLKDIVEIFERIKIKIQYAYLQKLEISVAVSDIISNCLEIEQDKVIPAASFADDLGVESLDWFELIFTLEKAFSIEISDEIAGTFLTVQQLVDYVAFMVFKSSKFNYFRFHSDPNFR